MPRHQTFSGNQVEKKKAIWSLKAILVLMSSKLIAQRGDRWGSKQWP
jgi:hypothetical protein